MGVRSKLPPRQKFFRAFFLIGLPIILAAIGLRWKVSRVDDTPIKIGVIHSLTGTMAASESPIITAIQMAVDEINKSGGLLDRQVQIVVADSGSDAEKAALEARKLIEQDKVAVLFACWTSSCRKAIKPIVEEFNHLMFYPVQYEGLEQSPNIIYTGAAPNQQIVPGTSYALKNFGKDVFLVGSDYVFPRVANLIIRDIINAHHGKVLSERYIPLGSQDISAVVAEIKSSKPDVVLNTVNGDSNSVLFKALVAEGLADLPIVSFSAAEPEMALWKGGQLTRHFAVWSYFQSMSGLVNANFVKEFTSRAGSTSGLSDPVETSYVGVKLWAAAVREVRSTEPRLVNDEVLIQGIEAPHGIAAIDLETRHMWRQVRIGRTLESGQFEEVYVSPEYIRPAPWPGYRTHAEWDQLRRGIL